MITMRNSYLLSILLVASGISGLSAQIPLIPNEARALYNYQMKDRVAPVVVADENLTVNEIYRSPVDGCYFGIGDARNTYDPAGIDCEECENAGGRAKINGSYVWGLTESDKKYTGEPLITCFARQPQWLAVKKRPILC